MKKAVLYINLGTPDSPDKKSVGRYLRQFLMDPFVIDIPYFFRWVLVNLIIAPFRSKKSAHAYQQIWTQKGSPLLVNSQELVSKLSAHLRAEEGWKCFLGMRYGKPSISEVASKIVHEGFDRVHLVPAYPQYALSSSETGFQQAEACFKELGFGGPVYRLQDYYQDPGFIRAVAENIRAVQKSFKPDHILFSYHGLPKRHLTKLHPECEFQRSCCEKVWAENRNCYRHQSVMTTRALVADLGLEPSEYSLGFQSRLGSGWIEPFTDVVLTDLAKKGVKRLAVVCPSFTADCLETLEEIAIRSDESFRAAGGEKLELVPCVNAGETWTQELAKIIKAVDT